MVRGCSLLRKLSNSWNASRCWMSYPFLGAHTGVPRVVSFVLGNYFFTAWQVADELTALGEILATLRPRCALEIGTARGGTLLFLTKLASPRATIISVDLPEGRFGGGYTSTRAWFYKRFARRGQRLELLRGDSHTSDVLERAGTVLGGQALDYLFIDGDHSYEGVKCDFGMYGPKVRKGGLIAVHDIVDGAPEKVGGVPRFWREIKSQYRHTEIIKNRDQDSCGIGVLYVD